MTPRLDLIGIIVRDMAAALAFYRRLGLDLPDELDKESHAECTLPNGLRIAWDTHDMIRSFNPDWQPASGGHRMGMAFLFDEPTKVDAAFQNLIDDGNVVDLFAWTTEENA